MNPLQNPRRSRSLVFTLVCGAVFLAACVYTLQKPRLYRAEGALKFTHVADVPEVVDSARGLNDEWTAMVDIERGEITRRAAKRLTPEEQSRLFAPYGRRGNEDDASRVERLINENQRLTARTLDSRLVIEYRHPDRQLAARVVNLLFDERIAYNARRRIDEGMRAVEELKARAEAQERTVRALSAEVEAYKEKHAGQPGLPFEEDAHYRELERKREEQQRLMDALLARMRDMTMISGPSPQSWRMERRAVPPNEDEYLYAPIAKDMALGLALGLAGGVLAVGMMDMNSRRRVRRHRDA